MNRIELFKLNYDRDCININNEPTYPEDMPFIREAVPTVSSLSDAEVSMLWSDYSATVWAAGYLDVSQRDLKDFDKWINSDPKDLGWVEHGCPEWYEEKK